MTHAACAILADEPFWEGMEALFLALASLFLAFTLGEGLSTFRCERARSAASS